MIKRINIYNIKYEKKLHVTKSSKMLIEKDCV